MSDIVYLTMWTFAEQLPPESWDRVVYHMTSMDDMCSLAVVNKYFYKIVNTDFKQLCYDHIVYRLENECWAYALSQFGSRAYIALFSNVHMFWQHAVCCPFTGKVALKLENGYVVLSNIDFGLKQFTLLDFTPYTDTITRVNMINRGQQLLVYTPTVVLIYDLRTMKVTSHYELGYNYGYQIIRQSGTVLDLYTEKEFEIDARHPNGNIHYINRYDTPKYLAVQTTDKKLVIINKETGERQQVCEWTQDMNVYVISENNSIVVKGGIDYRILAENFGCLVYSITRRKFVFDRSDDRLWYLFTSNTLFHRMTKTFLVYNKQIDEWVEVKTGSQLDLDKRNNFDCFSSFVPIPTFIVMEKTIEKHFITQKFFLKFKKDKVHVKTFNPEIKWTASFGLINAAENDNHPIKKLSQMPFPISKENTDFYHWFAELYTVNENVPLFDTRSGETKENFNFYPSK
ncbi:unnamed protein product [Bursaphelenchus okinawaensis]|uniref:F-box domain-containing protein n=1 Tax=Bursaphelenchus okinawaensis TaxID=465554 RepID=A0A811LQZ3_9BILA|nr:unnamed protein product [Bursaphelenchus okinawaensis]CAG9127913.1 unnamed protein product [Bursaphelenchus okinawaensis]